MDSTSLRDRFRLSVDDVETPYLWSDEEVFGYMDDAQNMFCRFTNGIGDATSARITQLAVPVDTEWVDLSNLILKIRGANRGSDGSTMTIVNYEDMEAHGLRFDGRTGAIQYLVIGMEDNKARIYPKASVADTVSLLVYRLPLKPIIDEDQKLEIDVKHHLHLIWWMQHLAYSKQDAETLDRTKASDARATFEEYCAMAKNEQGLAKHKTRVVAYGGI